MKRATFRGVGLFANGEQLNRVTAFGASGTLSKEEVYELGNSDIIEIVEDSPEISMTVDSNDYGSIETLAKLSGQTTTGVGTNIRFSSDLEKPVAVWNYIREKSRSNTLFTQIMTGAVLTGYSANFSTDGNVTESFTLTADNKTWLMNDGKYACRIVLMNDGANKWKLPVGAAGLDVKKILSVVHDGRILSNSEYTEASGTIFPITIAGSGTLTAPAVVLSCDLYDGDTELIKSQFLPFSPKKPNYDTKERTIKRRGHVEVRLVDKDKNLIAVVTPAQSASIDANLSREDIPALGYKRFYDRPLSLPIDVTASIDVIFTDLKMFAELCGVNNYSTATDLSLERFRNDLGLRITVFDRTDVDEGTQKVVKVLEIPQIIPSDEAWNISLDGHATQTFSFRGQELKVRNKKDEE